MINYIISIFLITNPQDTVKLPINGGIIVESKNEHSQHGAYIVQSDDTVVYSTSSGTVHKVYKIEDGYYVMIKHKEFYLVYTPLDSVFVSKGDCIDLGQPIGTSNTRTLERGYFFFGVLKGDRWISPKKFIQYKE
jgi:murein DD-endopeptidase MepM/ murein hydrolase activator NlpD